MNATVDLQGRDVLLTSASVVHPGSYPIATQPSSEAQASTPHGEIADQIPQQSHKLNDRRKQCEDCGVEPYGKIDRHDDRAKVRSSEGQSRAGDQVLCVLKRSHQNCPT